MFLKVANFIKEVAEDFEALKSSMTGESSEDIIEEDLALLEESVKKLFEETQELSKVVAREINSEKNLIKDSRELVQKTNSARETAVVYLRELCNFKNLEKNFEGFKAIKCDSTLTYLDFILKISGNSDYRAFWEHQAKNTYYLCNIDKFPDEAVDWQKNGDKLMKVI